MKNKKLGSEFLILKTKISLKYPPPKKKKKKKYKLKYIKMKVTEIFNFKMSQFTK